MLWWSSTQGHRFRGQLWSGRVLSALASIGLAAAVAGCGDDGAATAEDSSGSSTTASTTSTTHPDASDAAEVQPHIEELLADWDVHMTAILEDPEAVAADSEHPLAVEMAGGFTEDSPFIEDFGGFLQEIYIDRGVGVRPGDDGLAQRTTFSHFTQVSAEEPDFVSFVICIYHHGDVFELSSGESLDADPEVTIAAGEAHRLEGRWLLHRLFELGVQPAPEGSDGPCADVAFEESA